MALKGRRTRMVRMADRFMFSTSRQYSTALFIQLIHSLRKELEQGQGENR